MRFDVLTIFPEQIDAIMGSSIIGRAQKNNILQINAHDIREYTTDKHRKTDDSPYGGSRGMVMKAEPIYNCFKAVTKNLKNVHTVYMSPKGKTLTQKKAAELLKFDNIVILCGHYECVDQRVLDMIVDEEISVGDYVLTGGELPAMVLIDTVARMVEGVLPEEDCFTDESHFNSLLEYPHYTRPESFMGKRVPEVLLNGHHKKICQFRREKSIETTAIKRPEMLKNAALTEYEKAFAGKIKRKNTRKIKMLNELSKLQNGSDIRGIALEGVEGEKVNLTPAAAEILARAFAEFLSVKTGKAVNELKIGIGRDSRLSGPDLLNAAAKGFKKSGATVFDCSLATTPSMFMTTVLDGFKYDGSVMITASHLPFNRNGMKFFCADGGLESYEIKKLIEIASKGEFSQGEGKIENADIISAYASSLVQKIRLKTGLEKPLLNKKIVVDAGNGAGGFFVEKVLKPLGANTQGSRFLEPDGSFPNHIPNPEDKKAMESITQAVLENNADMGVIFDTDVDRAAAVSGDGKEINRNALIALLATVVKRDCSEDKPVVVTDSVTSSELARFLESIGVVHRRFKRGYKNVINECKRLNEENVCCPLAVETSGHGAFAENYFLDDGAYIICKLLIEMSLLAKDNKNLFDNISKLEYPVESTEIRIKLTDSDFKKQGTQLLDNVKELVEKTPEFTMLPENYEGIRADFECEKEKGWFLLRLSLHDPLMVLNIEARTAGTSEKIKQILSSCLELK